MLPGVSHCHRTGWKGPLELILSDHLLKASPARAVTTNQVQLGSCFTWQPLPACLITLIGKRVFPCTNMRLLSLILSLGVPKIAWLCLLCTFSYKVPEGSNKMPLSLFFTRLNKYYSSSLPPSIICSSCQTLLVALARLAVALESPVLWRFPTVRGKNNAVMVAIYLNKSKQIRNNNNRKLVSFHILRLEPSQTYT